MPVRFTLQSRRLTSPVVRGLASTVLLLEPRIGTTRRRLDAAISGRPRWLACLRSRSQRRVVPRRDARGVGGDGRRSADTALTFPVFLLHELNLGGGTTLQRRNGSAGTRTATSGVTGRVGYDDARRRTAPNILICRLFSFCGWLRSAWLSQSSDRPLGHEWATRSCLHGQRALAAGRIDSSRGSFRGKLGAAACPRRFLSCALTAAAISAVPDVLAPRKRDACCGSGEVVTRAHGDAHSGEAPTREDATAFDGTEEGG